MDASSALRLLVGLGNPGSRYEGTRHNVGFEAVDRLLRAAGGRWKRATSTGVSAEIVLEGCPLTLLKPLTYMNLSGGSVRAWVDSLAIDRSAVLVYVDDVALPLGRLRLRPGGSSGGHRGLQSIIDALRGEDFPRMRIGIHPEATLERLEDFVLSRFSDDETKTVNHVLDRVVAATRTVLTEGMAKAQSLFNAAVDSPSGAGGPEP
ncbi:MAG TPA: aminoacyl-tRNA hydrolase [Vicinamibacteria bacterium]|nr:aminoacyl-tRNA hydrolase [Vicinamibacteria bacterium]